jgi:serine/threonine protein kinase
MLTGKTPYSTSTQKELLFDNILNHPLERIIESYPHVDNRYQGIIDKATAKKPSERYTSCRDFLNSLEELSYENN